jgi:hypothetical protein
VVDDNDFSFRPSNQKMPKDSKMEKKMAIKSTVSSITLPDDDVDADLKEMTEEELMAIINQNQEDMNIDDLFDSDGDVESELPEGWLSAQAPDGGTYYYHETTRETTWERP